MNRTNIKTQLGLTFSTLALALLTACGGGGDPAPAGASPNLATVASVPTVCGVPAAPTSGPSGYKVTSNESVLLDGIEHLISKVVALSGNTNAGETVQLTVPLEDLREVLFQGYTPTSSTDSMGVQMGSRFQPGSVGCVSSVARIVNTGSQASPTYLLSWKSDAFSSIPLGGPDEQLINGFAFVSNFEATSAVAVFHMSKEKLQTTDGLQVCQVTSTTSRTCTVPTVEQDATQWTFKLPITQSGVYLLSAPREIVPMD